MDRSSVASSIRALCVVAVALSGATAASSQPLDSLAELEMVALALARDINHTLAADRVELPTRARREAAHIRAYALR